MGFWQNWMLWSIADDSIENRRERERAQEETQRIQDLKQAVYQCSHFLEELEQEAPTLDQAELEQALQKTLATYKRIRITELEEIEYKDLYNQTLKKLENWLKELEQKRNEAFLNGITSEECGKLPWRERYEMLGKLDSLEQKAEFAPRCQEKRAVLEASWSNEEAEYIKMLRLWERLKKVADVISASKLKAYCRCWKSVPEFKAIYAKFPEQLNVPKAEVEKVLKKLEMLIAQKQNQALIGKFLLLMAESDDKKAMKKALNREDGQFAFYWENCFDVPELTALPGFPQFKNPKELSNFLAALDRLKNLFPAPAKDKLRDDLERHYHSELTTAAVASPSVPKTVSEPVLPEIPSVDETESIVSGREVKCKRRTLLIILAIFLPGVQFFCLGRTIRATILLLLDLTFIAWPLVGIYSVLDAFLRYPSEFGRDVRSTLERIVLSLALLFYILLLCAFVSAITASKS